MSKAVENYTRTTFYAIVFCLILFHNIPDPMMNGIDKILPERQARPDSAVGIPKRKQAHDYAVIRLVPATILR